MRGILGMKTPVTIRQVAETAGVSIQTVSRVINNRYDVAAETRQRVQGAIQQLGYQPNAIARGLASKRSQTLGIVTYDFSDQFFTQVVTGAEREAHRHNYFLMLGSTVCGPNEEPKYLRLLTERHVEGVLLARLEGGQDDEIHLRELSELGVPVVVTGFHPDRYDFHLVDIDNHAGGYLAARCLIENGHRRIATITGPLTSQSARDRLAGYQKALAEAEIPYDERLVVEGEYSHRSGYQAMQQLLERKVPFDAIFSHNDRMAIAAISALRAAGLRVPEDISIVGYDDIPEAEFAVPPLTTIRQPAVEVGASAVRLLFNMIDHPETPPQKVILGVELIRRESVARKSTDESAHKEVI